MNCVSINNIDEMLMPVCTFILIKIDDYKEVCIPIQTYKEFFTSKIIWNETIQSPIVNPIKIAIQLRSNVMLFKGIFYFKTFN